MRKKLRKKMKKKNENKKIKTTPIIGIITLEDLIETWLKIHILDEDNFEKEEISTRKRRNSTI